MPRQGRKHPKPAAKQPKPASLSSTVSATNAINYKVMKRSELQHCCKELGIRATGKNVELVERLQAYHAKPEPKSPGAERTGEHHQPAKIPLAVPCPNLSQKVKSEPVEKKKEGWCVVHGMVLLRPSSSWAPLLLQRGSVFVQDGENLIPFHLHPLNIPVPDGLLDNYICGDCVLRNRVTAQKFCHQTSPKYSTSYLPPPPSCGSKDKRKSYQPQEDRAYAQRVDGLLDLMARGELGMDQVLQPLQPLVVHSPAPFSQ